MQKARSKPFERFGTYILFKKIDTDALGELWRVGAIERGQIASLLALRKLSGDRSALAGAVSAASPLVSAVEGAAIVRRQSYGVLRGEPFMSWDYAGGRSLRHVVDRTREGGHLPIPTDQALAIAEKVALALDHVSNVKVDGKRLLHGALIPQFVWISEDGDVRVAGQYLNAGILASLSNPDVAREIGPFVAPEIRNGGTPTRATEVYSIGAILYLVITGQEPPDSSSGQVASAISSATLMEDGEPIPNEIRTILQTAMAADPAARFPGPAEVKQAITEVLGAGQYAPTTFNLAFYLHSLLRKEMEGEAVEREKESKVNPDPYVEEIAEERARAAAPRPAPVPAATASAAAEPQAPAPISAPAFGSSMQASSKSRAPLVATILLVAAAAAGGAWYMMKGKAPAEPQVAQVSPAATETQAPSELEQVPLEEPVVTEIPGVEAEAPPQDDAEAARRKAMEDEVNRRVQEEMRKLQDEHNRQLKAQQAAAARPPEPKQKPAEQTAPATVPDKTAAAEPEKPSTGAPAASEPAPAQQQAQQQVAPPPVTAPPPSRPPVREVKEGDLVVTSELDTQPQVIRRIAPTYPPIAAKQKISAFVIVSALVDERGKVIDAKILKGEAGNFGFDDAALVAIRKFTFEPAMKDGKKVKTWHAVPFIFGKQQ
jgi:TonB family protein